MLLGFLNYLVLDCGMSVVLIKNDNDDDDDDDDDDFQSQVWSNIYEYDMTIKHFSSI